MKIRRELNFRGKVNMLQLGDVISFKLKDGERVEARAIKEIPGGNMLMWFENCLKTEYPMNKDDSNEGGWNKSDARKYLNIEVIKRFPNKILKHMIPDYNGDWLHLLSIEEVFGKTWDGKDAKDEQIPLLRNNRYKLKLDGMNGLTQWYWLRSPHLSVATGFCVVSIGAAAYCSGASNAFGLAPAFYLSISESASLSRDDERSDENEG